jgi:hypothetical protein
MLDVGPANAQRVQVVADTPREIDLQIGAGMQPRLSPVAAKIGSGRCPENAFVRSGHGLIGISEGTHNPRSGILNA